MKIESVKIKNFRSFKEQTINFNNYTCLVGSNGSGKSTVLYALNIFFREKQGSITEFLQEEDFYHKNIDEPIEITVTFCDLSIEAQQDFKDYYRQEKLIITVKAEFNQVTKRAEVRHYGNRLVITDFKEFFTAKNAEQKKEIYKKIREKYTELPQETAANKMEKSLRDYEENNKGKCSLEESGDQFYGISQGNDKLNKYIQWVYVPAVKDVTIEQTSVKNTALERLLARTVKSKINFSEDITKIREEFQKEYQKLLLSKQSALKDISESLGKKLNEWAHPNIRLNISWQPSSEKIKIEEPLAAITVGEGNFEGDLVRFGHGLQRSYLLALLQELAECDDNLSPKLILGCEEPELYQHPPQQKHLSSVLKDLSKKNSQVMVTTHSPLFVSGEVFEDVRLVKKDNVQKESFISSTTYEEFAKTYSEAKKELKKKSDGILTIIHQILQPSLNEMFFSPRLILVEGLEDIAYITTYLHLLKMWSSYRSLGYNIVQVGGKSNLLKPLIIAKHMGIKTYTIFDSDANETNSNRRSRQEIDNKAILNLLNSPQPDPFPESTIWGDNFVMWNTNIGDIVRNDIGEIDWMKFKEKAEYECGHAGDLEKNSLFIASILTLAWNENKKSSNLENLCNKIIGS